MTDSAKHAPRTVLLLLTFQHYKQWS